MECQMQIQPITVPYRYDEPDEGLGLGPAALLAAGLVDRLGKAGHRLTPVQAASLADADREEGRTAVNIGKLGASTAGLVAGALRSGSGVLVLAGDDTAAVGVVAGLQEFVGDARLGVVWFDAHGDFNTPDTSFSGILAGMPVAIIAGYAGPHWRGAAGLSTPVRTGRIMLAGVRELDQKEEELLETTSVQVVQAEAVRERESFAQAVHEFASAIDLLLLHVDLDVLDPQYVPSSSTPSANGLSIEETVDAMASVFQTDKVIAVCVSSLNPGGGQRGIRSVKSAATLIEKALAAWTTIPSAAGN
jgi:arginase